MKLNLQKPIEKEILQLLETIKTVQLRLYT